MVFWTTQQHGILKTFGEQLHLTADFGTGKTALLVQKACEIATKKPENLVKLIIVPPLTFRRVCPTKEPTTPDEIGVKNHRPTLLETRLRKKARKLQKP